VFSPATLFLVNLIPGRLTGGSPARGACASTESGNSGLERRVLGKPSFMAVQAEPGKEERNVGAEPL
jgi:hypothetical protein